MKYYNFKLFADCNHLCFDLFLPRFRFSIFTFIKFPIYPRLLFFNPNWNFNPGWKSPYEIDYSDILESLMSQEIWKGYKIITSVPQFNNGKNERNAWISQKVSKWLKVKNKWKKSHSTLFQVVSSYNSLTPNSPSANVFVI